jgi:hypothetical protein
VEPVPYGVQLPRVPWDVVDVVPEDVLGLPELLEPLGLPPTVEVAVVVTAVVVVATAGGGVGAGSDGGGGG